MLEPNCICLQEQLLTFWEFCSLTAKATNQNLTSFLRTGFVCLFVFSIYHLAVPVVVPRIFRVACRLLVVAHGIQCPDQRVNLGPQHWVLTITEHLVWLHGLPGSTVLTKEVASQHRRCTNGSLPMELTGVTIQREGAGLVGRRVAGPLSGSVVMSAGW